jgi:hypothetical protein
MVKGSFTAVNLPTKPSLKAVALGGGAVTAGGSWGITEVSTA